MKELGINIISIKKIMLELQENDGQIYEDRLPNLKLLKNFCMSYSQFKA